MIIDRSKAKKYMRTRPMLTSSVAMVLVLFATSVDAQWHVVDDTAIANNKAGFASQLAKTVDQYTTQLKEYATQLEQYRQMLSSIQGLSTGMSLTPNTLQTITNSSSIIEGRCAGPGGADTVNTIMNSMSALMGQSISQTQQAICVKIVTQQIDKYNKTVTMLNKLHGYAGEFQQVESVVRAMDTFADTGRASVQVEQYGKAVQTEMADWQAEMQIDDSVIATLQSQQSILAHIALKGSNTTLGNVVQAAAFAGAFHN